jgi:eukaryotic-like serine/threonine-protein kinase
MNRKLCRLSLILSVSYLVFSLCSCGTQPSAPLTLTTTSAPPVSTSCPPSGTARAAVMPPLAPGHSQDIVYVYNQGSYQHPVNGILRRYDVSTHSKTDIVKLSNTWLDDIQLSTDGQWMLFLSKSYGHIAIQLVRIDGQELQTLFCPTTSQDIIGAEVGGISWSPDQRSLIFPLTTTGDAQTPPDVLGIYLLDMVTGKLQKELGAVNAFPSIWLDNSRIYLIDPLVHMTPVPHDLSLWDIGKSTQEQQMHTIATVNLCGDFDVSPDKTQLLLSQCAEPLAGETTGPSTITTQSATGGSLRIIYSNPTLAITTIRMISSTTLLIIVKNSTSDRSQNGLWKINRDGSNRTLLESTNSLSSLNLSRNPVSRDGSLYSYMKTDFEPTGAPVSTSLVFGSLNGGGITTFETLGPDQGMLVLVGWTTM